MYVFTLEALSNMACSVSTALYFLLTIAIHLGELGELRRTVEAHRDNKQRKPVYIGVLLPTKMDTNFDMLPTVQAAVDHVNELNGILDDYVLRIRWNLTERNPANALRIVNDFVQESPPVSMVWGPIFSNVAVIVNEVLPRYNLIQVVTASSTTLQNRAHYPLTVQVAAIDDEFTVPSKVAFVKLMGWTKVAVIFQDNQYFRHNIKSLTGSLEGSGVTILTTETVKDLANLDEQIQSLKRHDARIIFAGFYSDECVELICKVSRANLTDSKHVWILPGWYPDGWWQNRTDSSCSNEEITRALEFHFEFGWDLAVKDVSLIDFNGVNPKDEHLEFFSQQINKKDNNRHLKAYDCLITIALALNASIQELQELNPPKGLDEFSYDDYNMTQIFWRNTLKTGFVGLTGPVSFNEAREHNVSSYIAQFQDGRLNRVAQYFPDGVQLIPNMPIKWKGSYRPVDGEHETNEKVRVSDMLKLVILTLTSFGVLLALIFLGINITLRNQRAIKISSPQINNLIVCGCLLLYCSVFVTGVDTSGLSNTGFIILCHVEVLIMSVGFSLSFGSLLVKTYRIFAIFKKAVEKFKKIDLPDRKLILAVGLLVVVDCLIITVWAFIGQTTVKQVPLKRKLSDTASPDREIYVIPVLHQCYSQYDLYFTCVIYGFKGIILVFGIFLAWETREVKVMGLDDSKYIILSICIVGITIVLAIPTLHVFAENADLQFCCYGIAVVFANTMVLCVVFLPKFYLWYTTRGGALRMTMMDMTISSSTSLTGRNRWKDLHKTREEKLDVLTDLLKEYKVLFGEKTGPKHEHRRQYSSTKLSAM